MQYGYSAFDVSHMGQIEVEGPQRARAAAELARRRHQQYQVPDRRGAQFLTNKHGGILDDLITWRAQPLPLPPDHQCLDAEIAFHW